ncbi:hypothetical protein BH11PLA2_BH11PLA2_05540 [soil metagenome]
MSFAKLTRWLKEPSKLSQRRVPASLQVNHLEDRCTPSATLQDVNGSFSGAGNKPSNLLGQSDDGRYIIFESQATDLVVGQSDIPNTNDLFWRDLQTGETRMVSALPNITNTTYDYAATRLSPSSFALQAVVDGAPVLPSFNKAVISGDGRFVAFSSVVNAARLDVDYATSTYAPFSNNTTTVDLSNTLDVFRWTAKSGVIELASRTAASGSTNGDLVAFGRYGSSDTPSISSDGTNVGFVSRVDAWYTSSKGKPTAFAAGIIVDGGNTNDIFDTNFDANTGAKISVVSAVTTAGTGAANDPDFIRTYGHLAGGDGVSADSLGRYISNDIGGALSFVGTVPVDPTFYGFEGIGYGTSISFSLTRPLGNGRVSTVNADTGNANAEAYRFNIQAGLIGDLTVDHLTSTGVSAGKFGGNTGVTLNGGNAQNVIIARTNPQAVLLTTSTAVGTVSNGQFNSFPLAPSSKRQDLYFVRTDINSQTVKVLNSQRLPSTTTSTTVTDTTQYSITPNGKYLVYSQVEGVQADGVTDKTQVFYRQVLPSVSTVATRISVGLDGQPLSTGANSPQISRNGRFVTFASTTLANLIVSASLTDTNKASDVFVRDLYASTNPAGQFIPSTRLLSINAAGTGTGNGASTRAYVGTFLEDPSGAATPSLDADSVGRAVFNSTATNIDIGFPILHGGTSVFLQNLPIDGLPPVVPPTDASRVTVVSGGRESGITQATFSGTGTVTIGQRLTPYPGFLGEIRTASADVNGDGILDLIVAPGPGAGPRVIVFSGANQQRLFDFFAFEPTFTGGVNIAAADITGDGKAEIIVGADKGGGARVRVLDMTVSAKGSVSIVDFFAYDVNFRGGVRVAAGDVNGDGIQDVVTGAGTGGGPRVSVFNGADILAGNLKRTVDFFAMELNLRNGVTIAVEDMNNDGFDDIIVGSGAGGAPRVRVFEATSLLARPQAPDLLYDFFAGNTDSRAGIRVSVKNVDGDAIADIVTGEGYGRESRVRTFSGAKFTAPLTPTELDNTFIVFEDVTSLNGTWVG